MSKYRKALAAVVATLLSAIVAASTDNVITDVEWINVAVLGVGACAVFTAPNVPGAPVTKAILAVLTAILTLLVSPISDGITTAEVLQLLVAGLGAVGVYAVRNEPSSLASPGHYS